MKARCFVLVLLVTLSAMFSSAFASTQANPTISNFTPNVGTPGTLITITGNDFAGTTAVRFNGRSSVFTVNSNTSITATVPSGTTTGPLTVTNASGTATGSTFYLPPVITSFSPAGGPAGTSVVLQGYNFSVASGVQFGSVGASFSVDNDSRITATVPGGAATGAITVLYTGGSSASPTQFIVGSPPLISGFTPAGGLAGTVVTISGSNFSLASQVSFNGQAASFSVVNGGSINATVPVGATTGPLSIAAVTGTGTSVQAFFVGAGPSVARFTPASGQVGTQVHVIGAGYLAVTDVQFNGVSSSQFGAVSDTELVATVPSGAATGPISVLNPAGTAVSSTNFAVGPTIRSLWPSSVSARSAVGSTVQIVGESFTGATAVKLNGITAVFTVNSDQQITMTVPAAATTGPISVPNPTATTVSSQNFEIISFGSPPRTGYVNWPTSAYTNVPVTVATGSQQDQVVASDSLGGMFVAWSDNRSGAWDIYAQRITTYGEVAPGWTVDGVLVCGAPGDQQRPKIVADGAGGAIIVWEDVRSGDWNLYAQRVRADGTVAAGWAANGVKICGAPNQQTNPSLASDGSSGAVIAWQDYRDNNWDIYAQHVLSSGQIASGWFADGVALCRDGSSQTVPTVATDAAGGAYVAWQDTRYYTHTYLQHVTRDGVVPSGWPTDGLRLGYYYSNQYSPVATLDGSGGVLVSWIEPRCNTDVYVIRVLSNASVAPGWSTDALSVTGCSGQASQLVVTMISDGVGGAYVSWPDARCSSWDVYLNRVTSAGGIVAGWPSQGLGVTCAPNNQDAPTLCLDGAGGVFVAWNDVRSGGYDIYAHRYSGSGAALGGWSAYGVPVCLAANNQTQPLIVPGWGTGATICWRDERNPTSPDLYAQRLDWSGRLGDPQPILTSVRDLPSDQGGHVRLTWNASVLDVLPALDISAYGVWRRVDSAAAQAAVAKGARMLASEATPADALPGKFRVTHLDAQTFYWEGVATILARGQSTYSYVAETFADSTSSGNPPTTFMVDAHASFGPFFWDSNEQNGYSVDNIAPSLPSGLHATYGPTSTRLGWQLGAENDLAGWRVYRGSTPAFTPSALNLVATVSDTSYVDATTGHYVYKVAAIDVHGNLSGFSSVVPAQLTGVDGGAIPATLWLAPVAPNPATSGTLLRFGLPRDAHVSLALFDANGRRVRELAARDMPAGEHSVRWDGNDSNGQGVASGLYFMRLATGTEMRVQRFAVVR